MEQEEPTAGLKAFRVMVIMGIPGTPLGENMDDSDIIVRPRIIMAHTQNEADKQVEAMIPVEAWKHPTRRPFVISQRAPEME